MTPTDTATHRISLKASSVANADHVTRFAVDQGADVTRSEVTPTRLAITGEVGVIFTVLVTARANRWITGDAAFDAAIEALGRFTY